MLNENDVVEAVCAHLEREGWVIESRCGTAMRGIDVVARQNDWRLLVEAKGATSSKAGTRRFELGFNSNQAKTHVAVAAYKAMSLLENSEDRDLVAIALPEDPTHQRHVASITWALARIGVSIMWVDEAGGVAWRPEVSRHARA